MILIEMGLYKNCVSIELFKSIQRPFKMIKKKKKKKKKKKTFYMIEKKSFDLIKRSKNKLIGFN